MRAQTARMFTDFENELEQALHSPNVRESFVRFWTLEKAASIPKRHYTRISSNEKLVCMAKVALDVNEASMNEVKHFVMFYENMAVGNYPVLSRAVELGKEVVSALEANAGKHAMKAVWMDYVSEHKRASIVHKLDTEDCLPAVAAANLKEALPLATKRDLDVLLDLLGLDTEAERLHGVSMWFLLKAIGGDL
jgi:hypothetical protein